MKVRQPQHTPARSGANAVSASRRSNFPVATQVLPPETRAALQQLLFADTTPEHNLGEAIDRFRVELDGSTNKPRTIEWRIRCCTRLDDWRGRSVRAKYRDAALELYRRHGQATGSQCVNTLGRVLILCERWDWRHGKHDLEGLARVRSVPRTAIVSADHRLALLDALRSLPSPKRRRAADIARLLLLTGMRLHEGTSLEWANISRKDRYVVLPTTKNGKPRIVPLCTEAMAIIDAQPGGGRWVFPGLHGKHIDDGMVGHAINMACESAGIPRTTPHVLRHTFATEAMRAGVPDKVVAQALGHSSLMELERYQHARVEDVAKCMDMVSERMLAKVETGT